MIQSIVLEEFNQTLVKVYSHPVPSLATVLVPFEAAPWNSVLPSSHHDQVLTRVRTHFQQDPSLSKCTNIINRLICYAWLSFSPQLFWGLLRGLRIFEPSVLFLCGF